MAETDTAKDAYIASATQAADVYLNNALSDKIRAAYIAGYTDASISSATEASKIYVETSTDFINYVTYYIQSLNENINALRGIVDDKSPLISSGIYNAIQDKFEECYAEYFK